MTGSIKKSLQSRLHVTSPHVQGNPDSGMGEIFVCGIRITLVLESGIQLKESGIQLREYRIPLTIGIQVPKTKTEIQYLES